MENEYARVILRLRRAKGWTRTQVAIACDLHPVQVAAMEREGHKPQSKTLDKLLHGFGISKDTFGRYLREERAAKNSSLTPCEIV